ncbi:MAG: hypothetical protein AB9869_16530 [Verrucomicrobiia bacterium]
MKAALRLTIAACFLLAAFNVSAATLYVSLESKNPTPPFSTWATAANVIQDAVDAAKDGDTVLVTNGVYATGGRAVGTNLLANRVAVYKPLTLRSVNGPQFTLIQGAKDPDDYNGFGNRAIRCGYLSDGAILSGFTLTNGATAQNPWPDRSKPDESGGGVWCTSTNAVLTNCILTGNSAAWEGGGAVGGTLYNCALHDNEAFNGGGSSQSTLNNCTLTGNRADLTFGCGGGASGGTLNNCTLAGNSADCGGGASGDYWLCTLNNCTLTGNSAGVGGGACRATLKNYVLTGNSAFGGAGAYVCTLYACTLIANSAGDDGEAVSSTLYNSILYYNSGGNYSVGTTLSYCCTTPLPTRGVGNIIGPPLFMDMAAGDFRLREDSPCIDAGTNLLGFTTTTENADTGGILVIAYDYDATDILGNGRFIDGNGDGKVAWDIGAYEFNSFKPPRFSVHPQLTPDGWRLSVVGAPHKRARLQRSENLKDWEEIWSGIIGAEGLLQMNVGDNGQKLRFYRVVVP